MIDKDRKLLDEAQALNYRDQQVVVDENLDTELFWTGEMVFAAVLKQVAALKETHRSKSGFVLFGFEVNEKVIEAAYSYTAKKVRVEPQSFYREIRYMIGIVKNLQDNNY